jgi:hypothetical protein
MQLASSVGPEQTPATFKYCTHSYAMQQDHRQRHFVQAHYGNKASLVLASTLLHLFM